jgi:GAF domain-containing protein
MDLMHYRQLMQDPGEKASLEAGLRSAIVSVGADEGSLLLLVDDGAQLEFVMSCTRTGINQQLIGQQVPVGQGWVGLAVQTGETQIGAPIFKGLQQADADRADAGNPAWVLATPLVYDDRSLGVMTLVSFSADKRFSAQDAYQYEALAALVAMLLHKQSVIDELSGQHAMLDKDAPEARIIDLVGDILRQSPERLAAVTDLLQAVARMK